ncbi:60s ribosomal protein l4 [Lynx pardinus]|uniref:60s ribosomal protein l4 n=1 Tax=Lynx pardinus TaxID=191816 RepID=A0A485N9H2_LYNPA|nr:60s ribosomal protein l4 [Lynx pardinus]
MSSCHPTEGTPGPFLVVEGTVEGYNKTKQVVLLLKKLKAWSDSKKFCASQQMRAGRGKMRSCCCIHRRGPCLIYNEGHHIINTFRNIPGITLLNASKPNILELVPGYIICMALDIKLPPSRATTAFSCTSCSVQTLPESCKAQKSRETSEHHTRGFITVLKKNPLKKLRIVLKLNPYAKTASQNTVLYQSKNHRLQMDEAAAALEAKSDEKGACDREERKGQKGKGRRKGKGKERKKQRKPLGEKKLQLPRNQQLRKSLQKRNPHTTEEKKPAV